MTTQKTPHMKLEDAISESPGNDNEPHAVAGSDKEREKATPKAPIKLKTGNASVRHCHPAFWALYKDD